MMLEGSLAISRLDLLSRRSTLEAQYLIWVDGGRLSLEQVFW